MRNIKTYYIGAEKKIFTIMILIFRRYERTVAGRPRS